MQFPDGHNRPDRTKRIRQSPHHARGVFQNEEPTVMMTEGSFWKTMTSFLRKPADTTPDKPLPTVKTDLKNLEDTTPAIVWFGHSSYLLQYQGFRILVDPLLQSYASPVRLTGKPFPGTDIFSLHDLPEIDLLLLTHDHYDHLSYPVIRSLHRQVKQICTSLGVGAILEKWGVDPGKITELDWNESFQVNEHLRLTARTARHFSGRTLLRNRTLWSAFTIQWHHYRLFVGGDSGYGPHFKTIGRQDGPYDVAFLECGQYGDNWPQIHMLPEETAQAAIDLGARVLVPVHWAKFSLALHPWNEPLRQLLASAAAQQLTIATPRIGECFRLGEPLPRDKWW